MIILAQFRTEDGFDFGKLFADIGQKIKSAIFSALLKGIPMLMGAILAYSAGKAVLSAAFGGAKKAIASGASNLFGRMMGGVGSTATKAASTGVGSGGSSAAKMLQGASSKADGMTGAMTKGGKSGGFCKA